MHHQRNILEAMAERIRTWCHDAGQAFIAAEYPAGMDAQTLREIARDCGLSDQDLRTMIEAGEHSADEMLLLMRDLGLDPAATELADPAQFRQMQLTCTRCDSKAECRKALRNDEPFREIAGFCGNAEAFSAMRPDAGRHKEFSAIT